MVLRHVLGLADGAADGVFRLFQVRNAALADAAGGVHAEPGDAQSAIRIDAADLAHRIAAGAQRRHDLHVGFRVKPPRDQAADDDGIIDHHDAERMVARGIPAGRPG